MQKHILLLVGLFLLLTVTPAKAATYYVDSQNGNDSNDGLSVSAPLRTIASVSSKALSPGDAILFKRGATWTEQFNINYSGTAGNPIVISAYGNGVSPVIDAERIREFGFFISGRSYVTIQNIKFVNNGGSGLIRVRGSNNIIIDSCSFYVTAHGGAFLETSTKCVVSNSSFTTPSVDFNQQTDGIYSQRNIDNSYHGNKMLITNENRDQHIDGIQSYLDQDLTIYNNNIEQRNAKTGNAQGIYVTTGSGTFTIYNNVVNCPNALSHTLGFRNLATGTAAVRIYNNTLINGGSNACRVSEATDMVIKNNIMISKNSTVSLYVDSYANVPANIDYNIYYTSNNTRAAWYNGSTRTLAQLQSMGIDVNSKQINPVLNTDFSLTKSSPAIDGGVNVANVLDCDIEHTQRPQLTGFDIGAYEYKLTTALPVELTNFSANLNGKNVELSWVTSTEINNHGFYLEKKNGVNWDEVTFVKGAGNSNSIINYQYEDKNVNDKVVVYRLRQVDFDGTVSFSKEVEVLLKGSDYQLSQNYPNPFNPTTQVDYFLPAAGFVNVSVYAVTGEMVDVLENMEKSAGSYNLTWNATKFASGVYFMKITIKGVNGEMKFMSAKKLNLVK